MASLSRKIASIDTEIGSKWGIDLQRQQLPYRYCALGAHDIIELMLTVRFVAGWKIEAIAQRVRRVSD